MDSYRHTLDLLADGHLLKAISLQKEAVSELQNWSLMDELVKTEETYILMLKYFSEGADDPRRSDVYDDVVNRTLAMAEKIKRQEGFLQANTAYYSKLRTVARQGRTLTYYSRRLQMLSQHRWVVAQVLRQKSIITPELLVLTQKADAMIGMHRVKADHVHALLLGAAMVILGLHLQKVEPRVHIGADAQFLAPGMTVLMHDIHVVVGRVKVGRVVAGNALAVNLLGTIVVLSQHQQQPQPILSRYKLGVGTVHQLDAAHLVQ